MASVGKISGFYKEGNEWFCNPALTSDITITLQGETFHLHKFPLISKCRKIAQILEESHSTHEKTFTTDLLEFPGGPDAFLIAMKFAYGIRVDLTPRNIVAVYCAADYLQMTNENGEDNLLAKANNFFHKHVLRDWKECILALQNSETVFVRAEKLQIISKCLDSISMMVCTDPSLFGWPMMMYGSFQSPGGSILWNGINTGARIHSAESNWWFEDVSYLSVSMFERLIKKMEERGIRPENLSGAIMYYAKKYLPGLSRWQSVPNGKKTSVASFSLKPASVDQQNLLDIIVKILPERRGKSYCRFLLGLLRVAFILPASQSCIDSLEKRIGIQLDLATLESLLIPNYSDSDTLYNIECVERIIHLFKLCQSFSPPSLNLEVSPSPEPWEKVAKLIDNYIAEVASDVNLKLGKIRSLAESLPDSSRLLYDGLYRAFDIYFKAHPWLSEKEKEELCNIIDYQKLSIDACAHASQNERLPLRTVLQVLFFEQMQLRTAISGALHVLDNGNVRTGHMAGQTVRRDGWVAVVRENQVLKIDMENMRSRVGELEEEFGKMKLEVKRVSKSYSSHDSARTLATKAGCKYFSRSSDVEAYNSKKSEHTPGISLEQAHSSSHSRRRKSFSFV